MACELSTAQTGARGERAAVEYLRQRGFMMEHLNWRSGRYEIDIVAKKMGVLHFVEVKTRRLNSLTEPEYAINEAKLKALKRAITLYINSVAWRGEVQCDLVAVEIAEDGGVDIRYIENAMEWGW